MAITRDLWVVLRARDEASRIIRSFGNNVSSAAGTAAANMSNFERHMQRLGVSMQQFAMTSMLAGTAMAGLGVAGLHFLKSATDVAAAYDKQVRATKTQVDDISISLEDLAAVGRRVAREVEVPFEQMQETLFFIFSSMNVTLAESEELLKGFAKEAVAGQTSIENAARSNIAIMNALGLTTKDLQRIQDVQFQVVRKGVITYEELANVIGRALPAAARSGQSIETLGAMMAFLTRNGLSAAMAAASAARALESFAHPTTVKRLEQIGVKVKDAKGEFLPLIDVMAQMNKELTKMSQPERAAFFQELFKGAGGTIQARRFWDTAFKNFGDFQEMIGFMANSTGVFENSYATMADSVAAKTILLENKWMLIKETLGRAVMPHLLKLMTLLGQLLDAFERLPEPVKNFIAQFILWGSIISIAVGALVILIGTLAFFVSGIMLAGSALVVILAAISAVTVGIVTLGGAFYLAWQRSQAFRDTISKIMQVAKDFGKILQTAAENVVRAFDEKLRPALDRLWQIIELKVLPAIRSFVRVWTEEAMPKIEEAGKVINDVAVATFQYVADVIDNIVVPAIIKLTDWWEKNKESLAPLVEFAGQLVKWLLIIAAAILLSPIMGFATAIAILVISIYNFITGLQALWGWLKTAFTAVVGFFSEIGKSVIDFVSKITAPFRDILASFVNAFKEAFKLIIAVINFFGVLGHEVIKDWIMPIVSFVSEKLGQLIGIVAGIWMTIFNKTKEWFSKIWGAIKEALGPIGEKISDMFSGSGNWLIDAGKRLIKGLIDGIAEGVKSLRKKLEEITKLIPEIKGPKSVDLKLLVPVGKNIMQGFLDGIMSQVPVITSQLQGITSQIGGLTGPNFTVPTPAFAGAGAGKVINQNITIYTQEINPRINAEELGFELGDRS